MANQEEKPTLKKFIRENKDLISVLGIFAALALFSQNLIGGKIGTGMSFLFFSGFMLTWFELWGTFPSKRGSELLVWFETDIVLIGFLVFLYWVFRLKELSDFLLINLFSIAVLGFILTRISLIMKEYDVFNKLLKTQPNGKRFFRYGLGIIIIFILYYSISADVTYLYNHFSPQMDQLIIELTNKPKP
jgi:hypothetical protein